MNAILMARTDLLWFGGIGTYVRSTEESDAEVSDRVNDAIRITGAQVRAKVIGEGANLGVTQRGRIEAAKAGPGTISVLSLSLSLSPRLPLSIEKRVCYYYYQRNRQEGPLGDERTGEGE